MSDKIVAPNGARGVTPVAPGELQQVLMSRLEELSKLGIVPGVGLWRRPFTPEETAAMNVVAGWLTSAGLESGRDAAGNLYGTLAGQDPSLPVVAVGSHLDTVKNGGNYDGALGTVAAVTAVEYLYRTLGRPVRSIEVSGFTGEEGSRFPGGFSGSKGAIGELSADELAKQDEDGITMACAMREAGFDPEKVGLATRTNWGAYIELHVEQGGVLKSKGIQIGLVDTIVGLNHEHVSVRGRADHAGTTPMNMRHDAMRAAAEMIAGAPRIAEEIGAPAVITTGRISVKPGATNIVPELVEFTFDMRHADESKLQQMNARVHALCQEIATRRGVTVDLHRFGTARPVDSDGDLLGCLEASARELGLSTLHVVSGAGHDGQIVKSICPIAMIFVPSHGGRSHTPEEYTTPEECAQGAAVIAGALRRLAWER